MTAKDRGGGGRGWGRERQQVRGDEARGTAGTGSQRLRQKTEEEETGDSKVECHVIKHGLESRQKQQAEAAS